jgi:hypothetical protein
VYLQPQIIHDTKEWTTHVPPFNPQFYPQESIAPLKESPPINQAQYKKPKLSYVELIAGAILSSPEKHLVLGDIYEAITDKYPYFDAKGSGWRNSIRHNLSLSDCFSKGERSPNGKGHFWEVNLEFYRGNGAKGKPKMYKKKQGPRSKPQNEFINYEVNQGKEIKREFSSISQNNVQKLSLLTQLRFDDEIREFEIARKKLTEVRTT